MIKPLSNNVTNNSITNNVTNNRVTNNYNTSNNNITNNRTTNNVVYNRGPNVIEVENITNTRIQVVKINNSNRPGTSLGNNQLTVYGPVIKQSTAQAVNKPIPQKVVTYIPIQIRQHKTIVRTTEPIQAKISSKTTERSVIKVQSRPLTGKLLR